MRCLHDDGEGVGCRAGGGIVIRGPVEPGRAAGVGCGAYGVNTSPRPIPSVRAGGLGPVEVPHRSLVVVGGAEAGLLQVEQKR